MDKVLINHGKAKYFFHNLPTTFPTSFSTLSYKTGSPHTHTFYDFHKSHAPHLTICSVLFPLTSMQGNIILWMSHAMDALYVGTTSDSGSHGLKYLLCF